MKRLLLSAIFFLSLSFCFSQNAKIFLGNWEGRLSLGVELRIVFHVKENSNGGFTTTVDSPDQTAYGIPTTSTTIKDNNITIEMQALSANFTGKLENDSVITGTFKQAVEVPLILKKTDAPSAPRKRPQTPQPPFSYNSEDVEYDNADKSVHLGATFTYPKSGDTFITAILITGSGQQDRDETLIGHKPFAVIADYLTKSGYAVLRVDDRGMGKTTGEVMKASSEDFAKDVMTSMDYLKTRKEVRPGKIGLIGHSEGGLIAALVLEQRKDVAFVISLAGTGMKGADILADQGELMMQKAGIDQSIASSYTQFYRKVIYYSLEEKDSAACFQKLWAAYNEWKKDKTALQLASLGFTTDGTAYDAFKELLRQLYSPWLQFFNKSDASQQYKKAYCPVLALNGSEDIQVIAKKNLEGIREALKKSKSPSYEIKELPGLNHLFQHCKLCSLGEYGELEETFAPEALEIMRDWLQKTIK